MTQRFQVTDVESVSMGRAVVGVNFWDDGTLSESPDLWFGSGDKARGFFAEAQRRGWTSPTGVVMERESAAKEIADLAGLFGGGWWSLGPFSFEESE